MTTLNPERCRQLLAIRENRYEPILYGELNELADQLEAALAEVERLRAVADAAKCIRHWHDSSNDGMVVSAEHVRLLWEALEQLDTHDNDQSGGE